MNNLYNIPCQLERGTSHSKLEMNPRGGSSPSSFNHNNVSKVIVVISLSSRKKVDTHVGERDLNPLLVDIPKNVFLMMCLYYI